MKNDKTHWPLVFVFVNMGRSGSENSPNATPPTNRSQTFSNFSKFNLKFPLNFVLLIFDDFFLENFKFTIVPHGQERKNPQLPVSEKQAIRDGNGMKFGTHE